MMWYLVSIPAWLAAAFLAMLGFCGLIYTLKLANADADASRVTGIMVISLVSLLLSSGVGALALRIVG